MRFVTLIFRLPAIISIISTTVFWSTETFAQINSPYSRFGIGDLYTPRNAMSKGMGGLATPITDIQSVNFINPASYASIGFVTFDVGIEAEFRTLTSQDKANRFESGNLIFNYAAMGVPLMKNKKQETVWGMAFGLRPYSRVRYDIIDNGRISDIDSVQDEYRGNGGLYRAFLGTGFKLGSFSLGVNIGYIFGQKELGTYRTLINDTISYYSGSLVQRTSITKFAADAGFQWEIKTGKKSLVRLAGNGHLGGAADAQRERLAQTVFFNSFGNPDSIDVVMRDNTRGTYNLPAGYTAGIAYEKRNKFLLGVEYETSKWSELTNFGQPSGMGDINIIRADTQWIPDIMSNRNYYKQIAYRAGFFAGRDYVVVDGHQLPVWGLSFGAGIPIRRYSLYSTQFNTVNFSFEYGRRGNGQSPYTERYFRVNFGLALSDMWFIKRQYD